MFEITGGKFSSCYSEVAPLQLEYFRPRYSFSKAKKILDSTCCYSCKRRDFFLCSTTDGEGNVFLLRDNRPKGLFIFNPATSTFSFEIPKSSLKMKNYTGTIVWNLEYYMKEFLCFGVGFDSNGMSNMYIGKYNPRKKRWSVVDERFERKLYYEANRQGLGRISIQNHLVTKYGGYQKIMKPCETSSGGESADVVNKPSDFCSQLFVFDGIKNVWNQFEGVSLLKCFSTITHEGQLYLLGEQQFKNKKRIRTQIWKQVRRNTGNWVKIHEFSSRRIDYKKKTHSFSYGSSICWVNNKNLTIVKNLTRNVKESDLLKLEIEHFPINLPSSHSVSSCIGSKLYFFVGRPLAEIEFEIQGEEGNVLGDQDLILRTPVFCFDLSALFVPRIRSRDYLKFFDVLVITQQ